MMRKPMTANVDGALDHYAMLERLDLAPLWEYQTNLFPKEPSKRALPFLWHYEDIRPELLHFGDALSMEKAERRVLMLINPGLREQAATVANIYAGFQLILPRETARAHRHTSNAFRFIVEGEGASTTVDGEKTSMRAGDLLLTPGWAWHDHTHEGDGPMIWLDGLDFPLINILGVQFFETFSERAQPQVRPSNQASRLYAHARLNPVLRDKAKSGKGRSSPLSNYPWEQTEAALTAIGFDIEGAHRTGVVLDYVNPLDGGPVLPTMNCRIVRLPPGFDGVAQRRTASEIVHVVRGSGTTMIDGQRFDWKAHDTMALPIWSTHRHLNSSSSEDAILFTYSDAPVLESLGLYREDAGSPAFARVSP
jgi:gentisate 1,2-dioxygenase